MSFLEEYGGCFIFAKRRAILTNIENLERIKENGSIWQFSCIVMNEN